MSVKGMEYICSIEPELIKPTIANSPTESGNSFGKYFDFFKTENKNKIELSKKDNEVNENIRRLKEMFNNRKQ